MSLAAYTSKTWTDYADSPCLEAVELNRIDSGIAAVTAELLALEAALPTTYQPISAELSALAALSSTGYAKRTGAAAWSVVSSIPQSDVAGLTTALAGLQPLDSDLTAIAALTTTSFGRSLLTVADAATARTAIGAQAAGSYEAAIAAGTTAQYWRGDKTWQTLNAAAVGLGSVLNVAQEPALGNPTSTGYLLSSTTAGVRSWVAPYTHPATHPQSVVDSASGWITAALAGKQASSSVLTSMAAQSSGTGLLKLTAGVASLDPTAYLPLSGGALVGSLSSAGYIVSNVGSSDALASSSRIGMTSADFGAGWLLSYSASGAMRVSYSAGSQAWSSVLSISTAGVISRGAYALWDAGNLTNLSQLTNGPGYITAASLPLASTTTPSALGAAAVGIGTTWARADHVHAMPTAAQVGAAPASRQVLAGAGLSGGGTLSADVTLSLPSLLTAGSAGGAASVPVLTWDTYGRLAAVGSAAITPASIGAQPSGAYATWSGLSQFKVPRAINAIGTLGDSAFGDDGSVASCSRPLFVTSVAASAIAASNTLSSASRLGVVTAAGVRGILISLGAAYDMQFWGATTDNSWSKVASLSAAGAFSATAISREGYAVWDAGNLVGTRNEHNHTGVYLPLSGGTMAGDINLGGYSITSGSTGLGNGMVSSIGGNFTNLQVVTLLAATGGTRINLGTNLIPTTDSGVQLGQPDKRFIATFSLYSYLSYLDASVEVAGPVVRWKDRIVVGNGGVLPIVGDGCAIVAVGQGTGGVTNKPTTNSYQAVDYRKSDGTLATAAAGGNVIDLDLYGRCAFVVGVSSSRAQLIV